MRRRSRSRRLAQSGSTDVGVTTEAPSTRLSPGKWLALATIHESCPESQLGIYLVIKGDIVSRYVRIGTQEREARLASFRQTGDGTESSGQAA